MPSWRLEHDHALQETHDIARSLVGTVAVPSPVPASATVLIGLGGPAAQAAAENPVDDEAEPHPSHFYLKIVQKLTHTTMLTRYLDLGELRAIKEYLDQDGEARFIPTDMLKERLDKLKKELAAAKRGTEVVLSNKGVVYIHESTPVLLRSEQWVVAREASESFLKDLDPTSSERTRGFARDQDLMCSGRARC